MADLHVALAARNCRRCCRLVITKLTRIFLVIAALFADAYIQSASAQCGPNDKIYIDPRLLPPKSNATRENLNLFLLAPPPIV